ncbi:DUF2283 domain-containing protein [Candidatus Woesearchaeota archaeon]|nr:DUF2283 domain-containing protein [Candidatus Woesearchaeota archaeon]
MKGPLRVHYDEEADFLEISVGKPTKCCATEVEPGVFIRVDEVTGDIKSVGVLSFKKRSKRMKDIVLQLPVEVNFSRKQSLSKAV